LFYSCQERFFRGVVNNLFCNQRFIRLSALWPRDAAESGKESRKWRRDRRIRETSLLQFWNAEIHGDVSGDFGAVEMYASGMRMRKEDRTAVVGGSGTAGKGWRRA
jgi:hypothetical protein